MFKKLKDKLAEEVKSSPQRIQQFAQAAQAAVTSASSSISDITNNDLFSISDNDSQKSQSTAAMRPPHPHGHKNAFQDVSLTQANVESANHQSSGDFAGSQPTIRQRRLSNSSFASDVSFKLPSYESPSMYHLQSDMDVSASEAEASGPGGISLDRVTKEQLYSSYRRTQDRYGKYRTQYADLARHYKMLERENAKARSVLVETQDKALRRISELREQCSLEQSAKAHLEQALRIEIEEKDIKISTLTTKLNLFHSNNGNTDTENIQINNDNVEKSDNTDVPLIDLSAEKDRQLDIDSTNYEITTLNNKIEKMELLINKYKESLKGMKEKNSQLTTELQVVANELEGKTREIDQLRLTTTHLTEARLKIQELKENNEELQNKINAFDFSKTKETSTLETDLQKAQEEIIQLQSKIDIFSKREEENAISLAENKLSIHKELESKETEIKSLKDKLSASTKEVQSLGIVLSDYKNKISSLEEEHAKLTTDINELHLSKSKEAEKDAEIKELKQKCQLLEQSKAKWDEEYKCLELQLNQETAEKLAMVDRNSYLENKNKLISEENNKRTAQITHLQNELLELKQDKLNEDEAISAENKKILLEVKLWKEKYKYLEQEMEEERVELVKLQTEIEKLLANYESVQSENTERKALIIELESRNLQMTQEYSQKNKKILKNYEYIKGTLIGLRKCISSVIDEIKSLKDYNVSATQISKLDEILRNVAKENENHVDSGEIDKLQAKQNNEIKEINKQNDLLQEEIKLLKEQKNCLEKEINHFETAEKSHKAIQKQLSEICNENKIKFIELNELNKENARLNTELKDWVNKYNALENKLKENKLSESVSQELKNEIKSLLEQSKQQEEIHKSTQAELIELKRYNDNLIVEIKAMGELKSYSAEQDKHIKELRDENSSLKSKFESIVTNFKTLENELSEVRCSHTEIEKEKDLLSSVIEAFQRNEASKPELSCRETQTSDDYLLQQQHLNSALEENYILKTKCEHIKQEKEELYEKAMSLEQKSDENAKLAEEKSQALNECVSLTSKLTYLQSEYDTQARKSQSVVDMNTELANKLSQQQSIANNPELTEQYEVVKSECDILKEENRRLKSDIEGLQTYLSNVSKDNSALNDRLREVIASSDNNGGSEISALLQDVLNLKNEIQSEMQKNDELLRQNALLLEENLELKDQAQSHVYIKPLEANGGKEHEFELNTLKEKYKNILRLKNDLETKLADTDVMNSNVKQLQDTNQKLRSSNEKLERRLDEALVSLRHLHSLQENTELEYLRNVLFEYLTGTGTHSETLAKVLSAVVKFDENQTKQVIQKERERQGLLRQLGLL